jgi:hypothetical protein
MRSSLKINNAGLVILQGLLPSYFIKNHWLKPNLDAFKNVHCQQQAVACLNFLLESGIPCQTDCSPLAELLCGLPVSHKHLRHTTDEINQPTQHQQQTASDFIKTCQAYWPHVQGISVEEFKRSWLVREGMLEECLAHWQLNVTKSTNDECLQQSPFTFSNIHFPWMPKPLHVNWRLN